MKNTTKNQHYVPRGYLKNFSEQGIVQVYNIKAKMYSKMSIENICSHNFTYEDSKEPDNILENILCSYESKAIPVIDKIINKYEKREDISILLKENMDLLIKYMWLQEMRTDAGRIKMMRSLEHKSLGMQFIKAVKNSELSQYADDIQNFNSTFKSKKNLERLLHGLADKHPIREIYVIQAKYSRFITTDHPITDNREIIPGMKKEDTRFKLSMGMPISPELGIAFYISNYAKPSKVPVIYSVDPKKFNQELMPLASYWIISNNEFTDNEKREIEKLFES